jgi:hypothetical protein
VQFASGHDPKDEPDRSPEQMQAFHRRMGPPDNEVPGAIPFSAVIGRTDELAVAFTTAQVFTTGIEFKIAIRLRECDTSPQGLGSEVFGHHRRGPTEDMLLLGVAYPDGRSVSNIGRGPFPDPATPEDVPMLTPRGGGGGGRTFEMGFWITPLPPPGDLTIVAAWASRGVAESRILIPAQDIAQGVAHNIELWPWQPLQEYDDEPPESPKPVLAADSWFAEHIEDDPLTP